MRLRQLLLCLVLVIAADARAENTLTVDAPDALRAVLKKHLDIVPLLEDKPDALPADEWQRVFDQGLKTARELLATEGYFSPTVTGKLEKAQSGWHARYQVQPGPRTLVAEIDVRLNGPLASQAEGKRRLAAMRRQVPIKVGDPFRQADWDKAKSSVLEPLWSKGYPAAKLASSEAAIEPDRQQARLKLVVDSGPLFHFGGVNIEGLARYPRSVVENLRPMKSGEVYDQARLLAYQRALEATGYFERVSVSVDARPEVANSLPIQVQVKENKKQQVSFGLGASTDTGPRAQVGYKLRNLAGSALRLSLDTQLNTHEQQLTGQLSRPRTAHGYDDSLGLTLKRSDVEGPVSRTVQFQATRSRERGPLTTTLTAQYEAELLDLAGTLQHNQAVSLTYGWVYRTVTDQFYPRHGWVTTLQGGGGVDPGQPDEVFVRLYARHSRFLRFGPRGRLVARLEMGSVLASSGAGVPSDFLFRAGGDNSVRGYAYQSLGPKVAGNVLPTRYLATGSLEYNYFFTRDWGAALFVDTGDAAEELSDLRLHTGAGLGARYRSPVGPVNLDVAYGEQTREWRLHFTLGVAF
jgi:translocation and assembly module TamA